MPLSVTRNCQCLHSKKCSGIMNEMLGRLMQPLDYLITHLHPFVFWTRLMLLLLLSLKLM